MRNVQEPLLPAPAAMDSKPRTAAAARRAAQGILLLAGLGLAFVAGVSASPLLLAAAPKAGGGRALELFAARPPKPAKKQKAVLKQVNESIQNAAQDILEAEEGAQTLYDLEVSLKDPFALIDDESLRRVLDLQDLPDNFDIRQEWGGCGLYVVDQLQCGDCWAGSGTNTLGDRACIHLKADMTALNMSRGGAYGAGATERLFQASGRCVGEGTMHLAHQHGCLRQMEFASPQFMVSCGNVNITTPPTYHPYPEGSGYEEGQTLYPDNEGCNGGEAPDAWRFFYHEGLTSMDGTQNGGCTPYTSGLCSGADPKNNGCHACAGFDQCATTGLMPTKVTVDSFGWIMEEDLPARDGNHTGVPRPPSQRDAMDRQVKKMQVEMLANGPLHACIDDYASFVDFFNDHPSGVYNSSDNSPNVGGHCIELVGWGVDRASGLPYWTFKNSWGPMWANKGFGRFLRGADFCGIESDVWVGCPSNSSCRLTAGVVHNETWVPSGPGTLPNATERRHPTSALSPSRQWPGGKEVELSYSEFSHSTLAPIVEAAVRRATGDYGMSRDEALSRASRVWSRSARGIRVRVEVEGVEKHAMSHRHPDGTIAVY